MINKIFLLVSSSLLIVSCSSAKTHVEGVSSYGVVERSEYPGISQELLEQDVLKKDSYAEKESVKAFIAKMSKKHAYDSALLNEAFSRIEIRASSIEKSNNQPEAIIPYYEYKQRFVNAQRIAGGRLFLKEHLAWFEKAENRFGVPKTVIAAIIGVETAYGRITGNRDVFTSLTTLAFDYPRRGQYFESELEAYLLLAREQQWLIGGTKGSYSGALGMAQFMPSNYRRIAIDFDEDGVIDLWQSPADAIGSIANYLVVNGWQKQQPIVSSMIISQQASEQQAFSQWINKGRRPYKKLSEWKLLGVSSQQPQETADLESGIIRLQSSPEEAQFWLAYSNFYSVMSYNPSRRYAMATIELASLLRE